jgi:predicted PurR-regulated permease PerM
MTVAGTHASLARTPPVHRVRRYREVVVTVGAVLAIVMLLLFVAVVVLGAVAIRHQNRMFPKGFDRTGWNPEPGHASWLLTKFTWLGGGRGP